MEESKIINKLNEIKGITSVNYLNSKLKEDIKKLEEKNNVGVFEVLSKNKVLVVTHDDKLREPNEKIVLISGKEVSFPSVKFPEINAISASPGWEVHEFLNKRLKFRKGDASFLIGL